MIHGKQVIGIVVITTPGANVCAETIAAKADHPPYISVALPFAEYKNSVDAKDWGKMAALISESLSILYRAGADFAIVPSNTPHYAYDAYSASSPIPVLNILDVAVAQCEKIAAKKVAVLGTKPTMEDGLYSRKLAAKGIEAIIPDADTRVLIHRLIMDEIIPKGAHASRTLIDAVAERLKTLSCNAFILGCTELPIVFTAESLSKPIIDTTRLLAETAVAYAAGYS
jgi:aspartate racemase